MRPPPPGPSRKRPLRAVSGAVVGGDRKRRQGRGGLQDDPQLWAEHAPVAAVLGVAPAEWQALCAALDAMRRTDAQDEKAPGHAALTLYDLSTLADMDGKLTDSVLDEVARRIVGDSPNVALLPTAFLQATAPTDARFEVHAPRAVSWRRALGDARSGADIDLVLAPRSIPGHWCSVVVRLRDRTVGYRDSLRPSGDEFQASAVAAVCGLLALAAGDDAVAVDVSSLRKARDESPQQPPNSLHCGVCVLLGFDAEVNGVRRDVPGAYYSKIEVKRFRARWACDLFFRRGSG